MKDLTVTCNGIPFTLEQALDYGLEFDVDTQELNQEIEYISMGFEETEQELEKATYKLDNIEYTERDLEKALDNFGEYIDETKRPTKKELREHLKEFSEVYKELTNDLAA